MGAKIEGIGSNLLNDHRRRQAPEHRILPDMIEVGSFVGMAAMTGSSITIKDGEFARFGDYHSFRRLESKL